MLLYLGAGPVAQILTGSNEIHTGIAISNFSVTERIIGWYQSGYGWYYHSNTMLESGILFPGTPEMYRLVTG